MIPPLPPLAFISDPAIIRRVCESLQGDAWTEDERLNGRSVYSGCTAKDWPHFKAYFELLGWDVTPTSVYSHSGYVENAKIKPRA